MSSLFDDIKTFHIVNSVNGCAANKIRYRLYVKVNTGRTFFFNFHQENRCFRIYNIYRLCDLVLLALTLVKHGSRNRSK